MKKFMISLIASMMLFSISIQHAAAEVPTVKLGWTYYVYWYQWEYAKRTGIVKKWEDKMGVKIEIVQVATYTDSLDYMRNGKLDAVTVTNGDAWAIATSRKIKFPINGDFSDGNDVFMSNECNSLQDCLDKKVKVRYANDSVSDMLLFACYNDIGVDIRNIPAIEQAESDIVIAFEGGKKASAVTWKPFVNQIHNVNNICTSAQYPGYIVDGLAVSADMPDNAVKALIGIWYETVALMKDEKVLQAMAAIPGDDIDVFKDQLSTTFRLDNPKDAIAFMSSEKFIGNMESRIQKWLLTTGITAEELGKIGVKFPNGKVIGNADNVTLEFNSSLVQQMLDEGLIK